MDDQDDPYSLLGVSKDATPSQIKSAYRKAALRHHPDRNDDKATANVIFSKISNAYEILSDDRRRAQYDEAERAAKMSHTHRDFYDDAPHSYGNYQRRRDFHDPFEVFRHVFREEFGHGGPASFSGASSTRHSPFFGGVMNGDPFDDPFSANPLFGTHRGAHQSNNGNHFDPFRDDPFFAGGSLFGGSRGTMDRPGNMFGGGSLFDRFDDMFDTMKRDMERPRKQAKNQQDGSSYSYYSSSTSSTTFGNADGQTITTQTTRQVVDGKEEVKTERIIRNSDGTVERVTLDNNAMLEQEGQKPAALTASAEGKEQRKRDRKRGLLPWRRNSSGKEDSSGN